MTVKNKKALLGLALLCALAPISLFAQKMSKTDLQNMYMEYLQSEGYPCYVDEDGDVSFKYEGGNYYINVWEDDPFCFRIVYGRFWEIESPSEQTEAAIAASDATATTKVAKVWLTSDGDDVSISAEVYLNEPEDFKKHFKRMLGCMGNARNTFIQAMRAGGV